MPRRALFTIERISEPLNPCRYLAVDDDGDLAWSQPRGPFTVFASKQCATAFASTKMGKHASDARVVRHAVH